MAYTGNDTRAAADDDARQTHRQGARSNEEARSSGRRSSQSNEEVRPSGRRRSSGGSIKRKLSSLLRRGSLQNSHDDDPSKGIHYHHNGSRSSSDGIRHHGGFSVDDMPPSTNTMDSWSSKKNETCTDYEVEHDAATRPLLPGETLQMPRIMVGETMLVGADVENSDNERSNRGFQVNANEELEAAEADVVGDAEAVERPAMMMEHRPTFTQLYNTNAAPGMWCGGESAQVGKGKVVDELDTVRPNMPLEPEEYEEPHMPWLIEQMGMGEQPFSSLLDDSVGYINPRAYTDSIASVGSSGISNGYEVGEGDGDRKRNRKRQRKLAFEVIRRQLAEARVGIPKNPPAPNADEFKRADGTVDYIGYGSSRVKHYADTQLRYKMDYRHSSDDPCKLDRFLLTLQRLVEVSGPYQRLVVWLYQLARWDNPKQTMWWCGVYFGLVYLEMVSLFLWMVPVFVIAYHRLRPSQAYQWLGFERPETSIIPRRFVQEASSSTIGKGLVANRMWEIWRETLGAQVHLVLADVADWMERAKNCVAWKRPWASRSVIVVMSCMGLFTYAVPAHVFQKLLGICVGVQFFFLAPLQLRHERYRRMLWVVDWILWHSPTDVELALDTLYTHSHGEATRRCVVCADSAQQASFAAKAHRFAHTLASDLARAYCPCAKTRQNPVMILQTASSTCLDRLEDDSIDGVGDALELGKRLGKRLAKGKGDDEGVYAGLCADDSVRLPTMMKDYEEREWMMQNPGFMQPVIRAFSVDTLGEFEKEKVAASQPAKLGHSKMFSHLKTLDIQSGGNIWQETAPARMDAGEKRNTSSNNTSSSSNNTSSSSSNLPSSGASPNADRSFMSRAKDLSSKLLRRRSSRGNTKADAMASTGGSGGGGVIGAEEVRDLEEERRRRSMHSHGLHGIPLGKVHETAPITSRALHEEDPGRRMSLGSNVLAWASADSVAGSDGAGSLELMHEANELSALRNRDARPAEKGVDLNSLYAFRCIHQGKYGTLFVTPDRFIFRRSRIMGGRRSSVSSHLLSNVVALRKSTSRFSKSNGIQLLLGDGSSLAYFGLARRDDVFGFLLVRCGHTHVF